LAATTSRSIRRDRGQLSVLADLVRASRGPNEALELPVRVGRLDVPKIQPHQLHLPAVAVMAIRPMGSSQAHVASP
jgi:hypothetical protein